MSGHPTIHHISDTGDLSHNTTTGTLCTLRDRKLHKAWGSRLFGLCLHPRPPAHVPCTAGKGQSGRPHSMAWCLVDTCGGVPCPSVTALSKEGCTSRPSHVLCPPPVALHPYLAQPNRHHRWEAFQDRPSQAKPSSSHLLQHHKLYPGRALSRSSSPELGHSPRSGPGSPGLGGRHLGLCPEAEVPLQGRPWSGGCIPDAPGETGIHLEWKHRSPLCSRVATGISWSSHAISTVLIFHNDIHPFF